MLAVSRGLGRSTRQRWRPKSVEFGLFAEAVARRYDGNYADPTSKKNKSLPAVRMWTTWNEPNHPSFLLPQSERTRRGWRDVAPYPRGVYGLGIARFVVPVRVLGQLLQR